MRIPRVFIDHALVSGRHAALDPRAANHVTRVLRLRTGAPLTVFDGSGVEFAAVLEKVDHETTTVRVGEPTGTGVESPLRITLAQGISRGERMDYTLQKAVELGVTRFIPLWTERTQVRLDAQRLKKRLDHWQGVIISACEQCGRTRIPQLDMPMELTQWIDRTDLQGLRLVLDPNATLTVAGMDVAESGVVLLTGPEGGLSPQERDFSQQHDFTPVRFGPRILRTETAALAAISSLQALWGDFR